MSKQIVRYLKLVKTYEDFAAAALTSSVALATLPEKAYVDRIIIAPYTPFSGGTVEQVAISIGVEGNATRFTSARDVSPSSPFVANPSTTVVSTNAATSPTEDTLLRAFMTTTVGNIDQLTAGRVEIHFFYSVLD